MKPLYLIACIFLTIGTHNVSLSQECQVKITSPAENSNVQATALITGTATIPKGGHLWILCHQLGFNGYWPQGNGETQVIANSWNTLVYFGNPGTYGKFEVLAIVVDDQANKYLEEWVIEAPNTDHPYQPIKFPTIMDECITTKLIVNKTQ